MKQSGNWVLAALMGSSMVVGAAAAERVAIPDGIAEPGETVQRLLATALLPVMPREHRERIIAAGGLGSEGYSANRDRTGEILVSHDARYERLREFVSPSLFARMHEEHIGMMLSSLDRQESGATPIAACFAPGTDPELMAAMHALFEQEFWGGGGAHDERFQIGGRWTTTATNFSTGSQGNPITLTYSFAPDGALAADLSNINRPNQLFAWMNSLYASPAVWQPHFHSVFNRWGDLIGVTYIHETNDDGVTANTLPGVLGVRGDVRIFAVPLDGNFNVLAYNQLPNGGDMVMDAFDSFFNNFANNSRRLRNVVSHEHGHGLGFLHVCPINSTKLMEPSASTAFDGPQLDDILAGHRNYGDRFEPNNSAAQATDLGDFFIGVDETVLNLSLNNGTDIDFFRVNVTQPIELVVLASPDAGIYLQGPQNFNGTCSAGSMTDYTNNQNLRIQLRASNGTTVITTVDNNPIGQPEELRHTILSPGVYYVVINDAQGNSGIQRYRLDVSGEQIPFEGPTIVAQQTPPMVVLPNTPVSLDFEVLANEDAIINGPNLHYRFDAGSYTVVGMTPQGGDIFRATIPGASCVDSPEYYVSVVGATVGEVNLPLAGENSPFSYDVGEFLPFFEDDFETNQGWVDNIATASTGLWERGVPIPSPGAPSADYDGSGQCYVTGLAAGEDVDGGRVLLRSPALDLDAGGVFNYAYWFSGGGTGDTLKLDISTNGQITWTTLREYTSDSNGWQTDSVVIDSSVGVPVTYFRFVAEDVFPDDLVEAAIDAVSVGSLTCDDSPGGCNPADIAEPYGVLDLSDVNAFLIGFMNQDPIADLAPPFGVWDLSDIAVFTTNFTAGCP